MQAAWIDISQESAKVLQAEQSVGWTGSFAGCLLLKLPGDVLLFIACLAGAEATARMQCTCSCLRLSLQDNR